MVNSLVMLYMDSGECKITLRVEMETIRLFLHGIICCFDFYLFGTHGCIHLYQMMCPYELLKDISPLEITTKMIRIMMIQ